MHRAAAAEAAEAQAKAALDTAEAALVQDRMSRDEIAGAEAAMAQAEGDHKVALERCEALPEDQQEACKDQADADFEAAKAAAETTPPS